MGPSKKRDLWCNRLEPNIVFEDYKALQKIEKSLRVIGFREFRVFNSGSMPTDLIYMNRFWICLPRNPRGLEQAKLYEDSSRFDVVRKPPGDSCFLKWRSAQQDSITVRSPLSKYLRLQREGMNVDGEWHREMDMIIAKDYAILARFQDTSGGIAMNEGELHDYFLAGLRGLGTWGAAWFLDRRWEHFGSLGEDQTDLQMLLEVEYRHGKIYSVKDVSEEPQEYFNAQNNLRVIRSEVAKFRRLSR